MVRIAFRAAALLAALAAATAAAGARAQTAGESGLGRVSFIDHSAVVRSAAGLALLPERAPQRDTGRREGYGADPIELADSRLEAGRYIGLRAAAPVSGLTVDMGIVYQPALARDAAAGLRGRQVAMQGGLRYDLGAIALSARLDYAGDDRASGEAAHLRTLTVEIPVGTVITLSAGASRLSGGSIEGFSVSEHARWSVSGKTTILDFDVTISHAATEPADSADTPGTRTLFEFKRRF